MPKLEAVNRKILAGQVLERWLAINRFKRRSIVFTNGCFDILHRGHIEYLAGAAALGDLLVVGLNTDASVRKLKGPSRPVLDEYTRALILASLGFVGAIVLFDEDTPYDLIRQIRPQTLVKGGDYKVEDIVGYDIVKEYGGHILTIPLTRGFSSSCIIDKISGS